MRDATVHYCFALLATANNHKTPEEGQHKKTWLVIPEYKKLWSLHWGKCKGAKQQNKYQQGLLGNSTDSLICLKMGMRNLVLQRQAKQIRVPGYILGLDSARSRGGTSFISQQHLWKSFEWLAQGFFLVCAASLLVLFAKSWAGAMVAHSPTHISPESRVTWYLSLLLKQHCGPLPAPLCIQNL